MKQTWKILLATSLLVLFLSSTQANEDRGIRYTATLVPINQSGVHANVLVKLINGKALTVTIEATGLEPGKLHPQHIHGFNKPVRNAVCPKPDADSNGDGVVSVGEGAVFLGPSFCRWCLSISWTQAATSATKPPFL